MAASPSDRLVLAIFGPTGSGKTAVAEALTRRVQAEIVSADSAALYRGLEILTAAPASARLVGVLDVSEEASVVAYQRLAHAAVDEILGSGRTPLVVGGTGLYLRAAISQLAPPSAPAAGERRRWERLYDRLGAVRAHAILAQRDPAAAERVHANDRRRVVRGLELAEAGESLHPSEDRLWSSDVRRPTIVTGLDVPTAELDRRLEERARWMVEHGVREEARAALARPLSSTARKVMGLREAAELPAEEAVAALAAASRRLARYQRKWMRRLPDLVRIDADRPAADVADEIVRLLAGSVAPPSR